MRRAIVLILPFLAVALMGSQCEFAATSNNGITTNRPPGEGESQSGGGLVIVVRDVEVDALVSTEVAEAPRTRPTVQAALGASVIADPETSPQDTPPEPLPVAAAEGAIGEMILPSPSVVEVAASPVPEPGAFVLFGSGLLLANGLVRRSSAAS